MEKKLKPNSSILSNQKGNVTFYGMLLLTFMSFIFVHFIYIQQKNYLEIKDRSTVFLCQKSYINYTEKFIKHVEILNFGLKSQTAIQLIGIFFPGINLATMSSAEIKRLIQLKQQAELVSYLKNLTFLKNNQCSFDPNIYKTPYMLSVLDFKRNTIGETIMRNKQWRQITFGKTFFLTAHYTIKRKFPLKLEREVSESIISKGTLY